MAKDYGANSWRQAQVQSKLGPVTYSVRTVDNRTWKRYLDQLRAYEGPTVGNLEVEEPRVVASDEDCTLRPQESRVEEYTVSRANDIPRKPILNRLDQKADDILESCMTTTSTTPSQRRSLRMRQLRQKLDSYVLN